MPSKEPKSSAVISREDIDGHVLLDKFLNLLHAFQRPIRTWNCGDIDALRDLARSHFVSHLVDDIGGRSDNYLLRQSVSHTHCLESECIHVIPASRT